MLSLQFLVNKKTETVLTIKQAVCYSPTWSIPGVVLSLKWTITIARGVEVLLRASKQLVVVTRFHISPMVLVEISQAIVYIDWSLECKNP